MSESQAKGKRVTLRKKAAAEERAKRAGDNRVGSYRERLDWMWICARVRGAGVPESDVDDVAQVVAIAMSRAEKNLLVRPGQTERDARRATMRKIIRFRVADYRRDRARFYRMRLKLAWSKDTEESSAPDAEELALRKERCTALRAALKKIEHMAGAYEVVILNGLEEMPMREVVAALGIPDGTARNRMLRAKQVLRATLEDEDTRERAA